MNRTKAVLLAAAAALSAGLVHHLVFRQTPVPEAVRKLSGLRVAAELYRQAKGTFPSDYREVLAEGKLEAVPGVKLKGSLTCSRVIGYSSLEPAGTGCWGYVADPGSPDFGTVFIDSGARDPEGRYWTWF
ncbi:MAG: hypothetical protein RQ748_05300 [Elusimicrobiales bacterium]|nr:hypothetical protein [Elusimicrobiales bacterium]